MSTLRDKFAQRLRKIRLEKGISQQQLSRQAGFDRTYVGKIEREGKSPSLDAIEKIAEELGVSPVELFDFEDQTDEPDG